METHFPKKTAFYACIPFFLHCFLLSTADLSFLNGHTGFFLTCASFAAMFALFAIGWVKDFPRWSLPAIGFCLLFSIYAMNVFVPFITKNLLGFWAWLPFLTTLIISIAIKPSFTPVKQLFNHIKTYPKLILLIFFGFVPMFCMMILDEVSLSWVIPVMLFNTIVLTLGLFVFLTHPKRKTRNLVFIGSCLIAVLASGLISIFYGMG